MERGEPLLRARQPRLPGVRARRSAASGRFICYDCWFPEGFRLCALQGADIVCVPTNWVPIPGQDPNREAMANILCMGGGAHQFGVRRRRRPGRQRARPALHRPEPDRQLHRLAGRRAGEPGPTRRSSTPKCNLADARRKRNWNEYNQVLRDRRTDVYDEMLGAERQAGLVLSRTDGEGGKTMVKVTLRKDGVTRRARCWARWRRRAPPRSRCRATSASPGPRPDPVRRDLAADRRLDGLRQGALLGLRARGRRDQQGRAACSAGRSRSWSATARPSRASSSSRRTAWSARSASTSWPAPSPRPSATPPARS